LKGKVVLIVNTASECGFTPQYELLQQLHEKYCESGLTVIGFPCNQFGEQEPGDSGSIATFCQNNFGVTFQMMEKVDVNGDNTHPVWQWLKSQKYQLGIERVKWNFEKFLITREGKVYDRWSSMGTSLESSIEKCLKQ